MTQWKCFAQTYPLFVTTYGLVWSSSVTLKHKMMLVHSNVPLVRDITLCSNDDKNILSNFKERRIDPEEHRVQATN